MLSAADNELLTRTDAGTPMGELMRRFWLPFMLASELPRPDCDPVRVGLLGERLVAFRDSAGRVGLLDEHCPHRRASLFFGRNEECGLRCVYHGWKFDVNGICADLPTEPEGSPMQAKVRLKAYPVREGGGVLWAYLGPAGRLPDFPAFEWMGLPADQCFMMRWIQDHNYVGGIEGEIDSAHIGFLHQPLNQNRSEKIGLFGSYALADKAPHWKIVDTPYGLAVGARRIVDGGQYFWRVNQMLLPFYTMIAPGADGHNLSRMWVPIDDQTTSIVCVAYRTDRPFTEADTAGYRSGARGFPKLVPGTLRQEASRDNDYLIDRHKQRTESFSGIFGARAQDSAVVESAGRIADRSLEYLGSSDTAIIAMRKKLLAAAKALRRNGTEPPPVRDGSLYRVRAGSAVLPPGVDFDQDKDAAAAMVAA